MMRHRSKQPSQGIYQYIHLVSNSGSTLPTDLWVPSTYIVKPQLSWLYSAGVFRNFEDNKYETSLELYYKDMKNQVEYSKVIHLHSLILKLNLFLGKDGVTAPNYLSIKSKGDSTGGSVIPYLGPGENSKT